MNRTTQPLDTATRRQRTLGVAGLLRSGSPVGLTLIELLVVMAILGILVASAIPVLSPANDERRIREAARGVNTFLTGAQARAVQTGRPFGVALKKLSQETNSADDSGVCLEMIYVEQPPPFAGFDAGSRVRLALDFNTASASGTNLQAGQAKVQFARFGTITPQGTDRLPANLDFDPIPPGVFRPGDQFEVEGNLFRFIDSSDLDSEGYYTAQSGTPDGTLIVQVVNSTGQQIRPVVDNLGNRISASLLSEALDTSNTSVTISDVPQPYWTEPLRYKIHRQPTPTSNEPYQMPEGVAIDLRASGFAETILDSANSTTRTRGAFVRPDTDVDTTGSGVSNPIENDSPVFLMFSPEGSLNLVQFDGSPTVMQTDEEDNEGYSGPVTESVSLLVGLRENIPNPFIDFSSFSGTDDELQTQKATINWLNPESSWVTIGAQTGAITTSENAFVDPVAIANDGANYSDLARRAIEINAAREFARQQTSAGGR